MIKLNNLNKKGFTLVELLAVIVVLAIIMIVAVPAVINTMNDAQKGTFKLYAERVLNKAQEKYQIDLMLGKTSNTTYGYCYTLKDMELSDKTTYAGYAIVDLDPNLKPTFYVTLSDNNYSIKDFTYSKINADTMTLSNPVDKTTINACPTTFTKPTT